MKTIAKILYATDFSESSAPAWDYAQSLARLSGADLHVLHVVSELSENRRRLIPSDTFTLLEKEVEENAAEETKRFCRENCAEGVDYTVEAVIGTPHTEIIRKAAEVNADLIVMGTHGRTGIEHALVGSNAERVVRHSPVPVLTVRART